MSAKLCKKCKARERMHESILCDICAKNYCIGCEMNPPEKNSLFCRLCKNPNFITLICKGCGNGVKINEREAKSIFLLYHALSEITPKLGMTIIITQCRICHDKYRNIPTRIYVH